MNVNPNRGVHPASLSPGWCGVPHPRVLVMRSRGPVTCSRSGGTTRWGDPAHCGLETDRESLRSAPIGHTSTACSRGLASPRDSCGPPTNGVLSQHTRNPCEKRFRRSRCLVRGSSGGEPGVGLRRMRFATGCLTGARYDVKVKRGTLVSPGRFRQDDGRPDEFLIGSFVYLDG